MNSVDPTVLGDLMQVALVRPPYQSFFRCMAMQFRRICFVGSAKDSRLLELLTLFEHGFLGACAAIHRLIAIVKPKLIMSGFYYRCFILPCQWNFEGRKVE